VVWVCEKTVGEVTFLCSLQGTMFGAFMMLQNVTKLPNANKPFEQAKHMTMVCDMNGFECVKLSNTKGHLKARISNSHFKVRPNEYV